MVTTINNTLNKGFLSTQYGVYRMKQKLNSDLDKALIKYDAWFLVLLAVIMCLALVLTSGLAIWCMVYRGKRFTGSWKWSLYGVSVYSECK